METCFTVGHSAPYTRLARKKINVYSVYVEIILYSVHSFGLNAHIVLTFALFVYFVFGNISWLIKTHVFISTLYLAETALLRDTTQVWQMYCDGIKSPRGHGQMGPAVAHKRAHYNTANKKLHKSVSTPLHEFSRRGCCFSCILKYYVYNNCPPEPNQCMIQGFRHLIVDPKN